MAVTRAWGGGDRKTGACPVAVYFAVRRNTTVNVKCKGLCKPSAAAGSALVPCGVDMQVVPGSGDPLRLFDGECPMPQPPSAPGSRHRRAAQRASGVQGGDKSGGGASRSRRAVVRMEGGVAVPAGAAAPAPSPSPAVSRPPAAAGPPTSAKARRWSEASADGGEDEDDDMAGSGGDPRDAAEEAVERRAAAATAGEGQRPESPGEEGYASEMLVSDAVGPFDDDDDGAVRSALRGKRPASSPGGPSRKRSPAHAAVSGSDDEDDDAYVDALEGEALGDLGR